MSLRNISHGQNKTIDVDRLRDMSFNQGNPDKNINQFWLQDERRTQKK